MLKKTAIVMSLALSACGGGASAPAPAVKSDAAVGGAVNGLPQGTTLLLSNNSSETIAVTADGPFAFPTRISEGDAYHVTVLGQASGINCTVQNGNGVVLHGQATVPAVAVNCMGGGAIALAQFNVGVTVTGLGPGQTVSFTNNGSDAVTASKDGLVVFPTYYYSTALYSGRPGGYDVAISAQPAGKNCTLSNASGAYTGLGNNFMNVLATCK